MKVWWTRPPVGTARPVGSHSSMLWKPVWRASDGRALFEFVAPCCRIIDKRAHHARPYTPVTAMFAGPVRVGGYSELFFFRLVASIVNPTLPPSAAPSATHTPISPVADPIAVPMPMPTAVHPPRCLAFICPLGRMALKLNCAPFGTRSLRAAPPDPPFPTPRSHTSRHRRSWKEGRALS
jgi:hypothetical protein